MPNPDKREPDHDEDDAPLLPPILGTVISRRWVILLTATAVTLIAIAVLLKLPNRYQSEATLLVVQQQVPERYVVPTTTTTIADSLQAMTKEVLSRRRLLAVVDELNLYPNKRKNLAPEDLFQLIFGDIEIQPLDPTQRRPGLKDFNAFRIAYTGEDPNTVQKVTSTLTSLFIQENLKTREEQATTTTNFLSEQLELKKKQLDEQEQRLKDFKMQHLGELPEQQQGNLAILTGLQTQLQNNMTNVARAQQQKVYLESLLGAHGSTVPAPEGVSPTTSQPSIMAARSDTQTADALAADIVKLQAQKSALLSQYTARHPDVVRLTKEIEIRQAAIATLRAEEEKDGKVIGASSPATALPSRASTRGTMGEPAVVAQLRSQLESNRLELENLAKDQAALKAAVAVYEKRINSIPVREQELAGIIRDTEAMRQEYADLQKKQQESQLSRDLELNQRGQQFRLVDAPSFPTSPVSPKRLKLSAIAGGGGLALGLLLAFGLELRRRTFHAESELRDKFSQVPLVLALPVLLTPKEQRKRKWRFVGECIAGTFVLCVVAAAEFYVFRFG